MLIGIDVDGVLADFIGHCCNYASPALRAACEKSRSELSYHDVFSSLEKGEESKLWRFIEENPGFVRDIPMFEGVQKLISDLRELGTLIAVTSPASSPPTWGHEREHWLVQNLGFKRGHIIQTPGKEFVDVDVLIEDNPGHLERWYNERIRRGRSAGRRSEGAYLGILYLDNRYKVPDRLEINYTACSSYTAIINAIGLHAYGQEK